MSRAHPDFPVLPSGDEAPEEGRAVSVGSGDWFASDFSAPTQNPRTTPTANAPQGVARKGDGAAAHREAAGECVGAELLPPCPHCGELPWLVELPFNWVVRCENDKCENRRAPMRSQSPEGAAKFWRGMVSCFLANNPGQTPEGQSPGGCL